MHHTHTGSVGGMDVPEVVIYLGTECEHGLAHIVFVAPGALNGIDEVAQTGRRPWCVLCFFLSEKLWTVPEVSRRGQNWQSEAWQLGLGVGLGRE